MSIYKITLNQSTIDYVFIFYNNDISMSLYDYDNKMHRILILQNLPQNFSIRPS